MRRRRLLRLRVTGDLHHREIALRSVSAACQQAVPESSPRMPDPRGFCHQVISAVGEAFNNIALHGYRGRDVGFVEIDVTDEDDRLVIEMRDDGVSYDPRGAPEPALDDLPEGGLGAFIIRSFIDHVDYEPGSPNVLTLVKRVR